jgi:hypothetical protein
VGKSGHVATFDWMTGTLHSELQLKETCRDITYVCLPLTLNISPIPDVVRFLHDHSHYAVAQKKYIFIYDRDGVELHCLKSHIEPTRLEYLPYHWLLASIVYSSSFLSFFLQTDITSAGQRRVPEIPRHIYRPTPRRTPHQARRM